MRPSGITDGINSALVEAESPTLRFNEAVGYYRRNPQTLGQQQAFGLDTEQLQ